MEDSEKIRSSAMLSVGNHNVCLHVTWFTIMQTSTHSGPAGDGSLHLPPGLDSKEVQG